jgi:hypothetical protein
MRTPGPIQPSLRLIGEGASRSESLRAGALVSVLVKEKLGGELYRVTIGSRSLTASSPAPLETGTRLQARVERSGECLVLRLVSRGAAESSASALAASGLPNDAAGRAALSALLGEGFSPDARALGRVRRAALHDAESGVSSLDLAAKMEAKAFPAEDEALEALVSLSDGRSHSRGHGEGEGRRGEERSSGGGELAREPESFLGSGEPSSLERDFQVDVPEEELAPILARLLRAIVARSGGAGDLLTLFNHLRGPEGSWILVPFSFSLDAVDFAGSFRLLLPYVRGGEGRLEALFSATCGSSSENWSFFINFAPSRGSSLRLVAPDSRRAAVASRAEELEAELSRFPCSVRLSREGQDESGSDGPSGVDLDA